MAKILVVEDDTTFAKLLEGFLKKNAHEPVIRHEVRAGIQALSQNEFSLLLLDYRLPDGNGLEVLSAARKLNPNVAGIIMTSFNDVRTAVKAMRQGAFDFITKPVNPDELLMVINDAIKPKPKTAPSSSTGGDFIAGKSSSSHKLNEYIELVAPTDMSVIIQGESGTGKEYAARAIHAKSKRASKPFIAIDCGTLSNDLAASELFGHKKGAFTGALEDKKGQIESASGGTLFMDEIGNLSYDVQVKLLRALQERQIQPLGSRDLIKVDVRIIAATNDDLSNSISEGGFREDLYHRLNEFKLQLPALRERGKDLEIFVQHFMNEANTDLNRNVETLSEEVKSIFERYDWPGNLRELRNVIRRMVLLSNGKTAGIESIPDEMTVSLSQLPKPGGQDLKAINEANERELIINTLHKVNHNKSMAARLLNIDRKTLYSKIEKYGI